MGTVLKFKLYCFNGLLNICKTLNDGYLQKINLLSITARYSAF